MKLAARQMLRAATATHATATPSRPGTSASVLIARAGLGTTSTAAIMLKWQDMIASISSVVTAAVACVLLRRDATVKAPMASGIPIANDAVTRVASQVT